jgi:CRISPR-associated protein Cmr4
VCSSSDIIATGTDQIVLEEFAFTAKTENQPFELAEHLSAHLFPNKAGWHDKLINDLVILNDEDFGYFAENATEVITRVRISQQTGTVSPGALWTEEYLPAESILYSLVLTSDEFVTQEAEKEDERKKAGEIMTYMTDTVRRSPRFQLGGNATLGKGHLYTALHAIH